MVRVVVARVQQRLPYELVLVVVYGLVFYMRCDKLRLI